MLLKSDLKDLASLLLTLKKSNKEMQWANLYNKLDMLDSVGQFLERLKLLNQSLEERNLASSITDKKDWFGNISKENIRNKWLQYHIP